MKKKRLVNIVAVVMILLIGLVFGLSLEIKNMKLEEADAQYASTWQADKESYNKEIGESNKIDDLNNSQTNSNENSFETFYDVMSYATQVIKDSTTFKSESRGNIHAVITKSGLVSAGLNSTVVSVIPGSSMELDNVIKWISKKDKTGNKYLGLGFHGTLPSYAENLNVANRLNVAHYFDGMNYYVGSSKDPRVATDDCNPYVDQYIQGSYDEYMSNYYNDIGDLFYILNEDTVKEENIVYFSKPSKIGEGFEAQLTFTGEQLKKVTANIAKQHKLLLNFAAYSDYKSLTITLTFSANGVLNSLTASENFDTLYAILGVNAPINVQLDYKQTLKYNNNEVLNMTGVVK